MRLITWNCKGAFARKQRAIADWEPDVLILPECERMQGVSNVLAGAPLRCVQWIGENPHKGLGVVTYGDYTVSVLEEYDASIRWVLPLMVHGPVSFLLLAVWTIPDPVEKVYARALFRALERYEHAIRQGPTVIAGDFNQSVIFDKPRGTLNFAHWMALADAAGLRSAYHLHTASAHGSEPDPTFYLHHSAAKRFHIDFVFASLPLLECLTDVTVGTHAEWAKLSDHMPLQCTFTAP